MGELFQSFVYTMLGDTGAFLINKYYQNENILLSLFMVYALLLLYARCILLFYYPFRMKRLLKNLPKVNNDRDYIRKKWLEIKKNFPFYIIVPSGKELWVKRASNSSIEYGIAFFRDKANHKSDYEQLDYLIDFNNKKVIS